jgi:type II secretory pathway pseudopilin PulG
MPARHAQGGRGAGRRPPAHARAGFTIIELLVAALIAGMMVVMVSSILRSAQEMATLGQARIRSNAAVEAIGDTIRRDLRRASQVGFLCIADDNGKPRLVVATAGPVQSLTGGALGTAECVCLGVEDRVLFRCGWVLKGSPLSGGDGDDVRSEDLAVIQQLSRKNLHDVVVKDLLANSPADDLQMPPTDTEGVRNTWQILAGSCSDLEIAWTDGTLAGGDLRWFDAQHPRDAAWKSKSDKALTEFAASGGDYRAFWTHHNQEAWPKAVRVRFTLSDPHLPDEIRGATYEVICPVGQ